jgi:general secretion pathway protein L
MNLFPQVLGAFYRWIDSVAGTVNSLFDRLRSKREIQVIETGLDTFTLHAAGDVKKLHLPDHPFRMTDGTIEGALPPGWTKMLRGSRAEMTVRPARFLFRPLELPKRAGEFLDGIVRAQIDRLTPWSPNEAVYGWTPPTDVPNDRIRLTVASTARVLLTPLVQAFAELGAASVVILTNPGDAGSPSAPIKVFEQRARGVLEIDRIRRALVTLFLLTGLAAAISAGYSAFAVDGLDAEQQALSRKIAERRAALRAGPEFAVSAQRMLERRKQTTPSSVMVLEALSQILPDNTFVTELHIEGDKLQVVGITRDAPALIALIEQSPHFTHAAFYAPTTRTPGDPGERFHVEARIKPIFAVGT